ncbi:hypothetical protein VWT76_15890 [Xanthomonas citri pv. citri]|uniref:hypothetical protein n=1 Tax=Xanthomonas citri TaxID=346 RepID=UPI0009531779|nr:hypothetical protein [Xanthomonas citri]MBD5034977.1 hypothetical protein [Xanthomonas citri pv. citri]MBD5054739.1 hypothetical protein [Xanthomonas citri pv. citri]OLR69712.1 hypothetical protein BI311_23640 [Xanthomonas citri pv. citri]
MVIISVETAAPYSLTPEDLASVSDVEVAFATERLLPAFEQIPQQFKTGNLYTELASAIFYDKPLPDVDLELKPGFSAQPLRRAVQAHLRSWGPKYEHKIAGVGYMIACACELHQDAG